MNPFDRFCMITFVASENSTMNYTTRFVSMNKNDSATWFLPPNYSIRKIVFKNIGSFSYSYHDDKADITVTVGSDLFDVINAAHKDYQETLLIRKLNAQAKQ